MFFWLKIAEILSDTTLARQKDNKFSSLEGIMDYNKIESCHRKTGFWVFAEVRLKPVVSATETKQSSNLGYSRHEYNTIWQRATRVMMRPHTLSCAFLVCMSHKQD